MHPKPILSRKCLVKFRFPPTEEYRKSRDTNANFPRDKTERKSCAALRAGDKILLEGTLELLLLLDGLESTVTELGRGINPFELDLLEGLAGGVDEHGLAESHDSLLDTGNGALDHDEVVVDNTVTDETTETVTG